MAVALTSFVQPMLIGNQSSDSSIKILSNEDIDIDDGNVRQDGPISVRPSPSPSPSPSSSHSITQSPCTCISPSNDDDDNDDDLKTIDDEDGDNDQVNNLENSISTSQCRYCYSDITKELNVSQCLCNGVLCKECLINELKLTHGRANSLLQCTVCKSEYNVKTEFSFNMDRDCKLFFDFLIHCGLKDEQYLLDSVGGKIGFFLVILGINTWILSTSLLFAFPPNGCPIELYFMVSIFDFAVGLSTIWFIIKCRYLSPLFLSIMYFIRSIYILLGWIPAINFCNIYSYHHKQSNHVSILIYFLVFSLFASIIMAICWIFDLNSQYKKYKKEHGKLVLNTPNNNIKIEINDILSNHHHLNNHTEHDQFE